MKITIVSPEYPPSPSGEAANTFFLAKELASLGLDVSVITREQPVDTEAPGVTVLPSIRRWDWLGRKRLTDCIKDTAPDAILLMYLGAMFDSHPMITYLPEALRQRGIKARLVTRFENPLSHADPFRQPFVSRIKWKLSKTDDSTPEFGQLLARSDAIISLCNYHRAVLLDADPSVADKIEIIPPPCNIRFEQDRGDVRLAGRRDLGASEEEVLIGYIGYVYANKGFDTLLYSLHELLKDGNPLRLVVLGGAVDLVGKGENYLGEMQKLSRELGLEDYVTWTGSFDPNSARIVELMHAIDFFVLPFDNGVHLNNSSVSSVMTYGKALVTTNSSHADHAIGESGAGILVEPKSVSELATAIGELATNKGKRAEMQVAAREFAATHFSWPACIDATLACLGIDGCRLREGANTHSRAMTG